MFIKDRDSSVKGDDPELGTTYTTLREPKRSGTWDTVSIDVNIHITMGYVTIVPVDHERVTSMLEKGFFYFARFDGVKRSLYI